MSTVNNYRYYCVTESVYYNYWGISPPTQCPNMHTNLSNIVIVETLSPETSNLDKALTPLGRLLTTQTYTISSHRFNSGILDSYDYTILNSGNCTCTINTTNGNLELKGINGGVGTCTFENKNKLYYLPSKTAEILFTSAIYTVVNSDTITRIGAYTATDGVYLEYSNGNVYLVVRSSSSGSIIDTPLIRSSWNNPALTLDMSKSNIYRIRFLWFGFFFIELSAVVDNVLTVLHTFYYSNVQVIPYWKNPIVTIKAECILNNNATSQLLTHTCGCLNIYGGFENPIRRYSISGTNTLTTSLTPIIAYRLRSTYKLGTAKLLSAQFFNATVTNNQYATIYAGILFGDSVFTITGGSWVTTGVSNSIVEHNNTLTAFTGSPYIIEKHIINTSSSTSRANIELNNIFGNINYCLNDASDVLIIYGQVNSGTCTLICDVSYDEKY